MGRVGRGSRTLLATLLVFAVAACGAPGSDQEEVTIGLGYVPNIQFAPFYVADAKGYYEDAGLKVTFRHHTIGEDLFGAIVAGQEDMIFAAGDEVAQARSRDVPLVYVAQVFNQYPVAAIVPADSDIRTAADLRGKTVGIPGKYGATYIGLLALLKSANLTEQDIEVKSIGFTQVAALLAGEADAVMGYVNNEPIQLEKAGLSVRTLPVTDVQPLISNGLVALEDQLQDHPDRVRAIVEATLKGVAYVNEHPDEAVEISKEYVPGLSAPDQAADARAVLDATLPILQTGDRPGYSDAAAWQSMISFLEAQGQLEGSVDVSKVVSDQYLPD